MALMRKQSNVWMPWLQQWSCLHSQFPDFSVRGKIQSSRLKKHTIPHAFLSAACSITLSGMASYLQTLTHLPPHSSLRIFNTKSVGVTPN